MNNTDEKLDIIIKKLEDIDKRLQRCEMSCERMDNHIGFVEDTYDTLRVPLDFVRSKFNYLTGTESKELPQLKSPEDHYSNN